MPTASERRTTADHGVRALVAALEAESGALADRAVERIRNRLPEFRRLPRATLRHAVVGNIGRALAALHDGRMPTPQELEGSAAVGRERAEQGVRLDVVLHAYRFTVSTVWDRLVELARERRADVGTVLAFSQTLWRWADAVMDVVATAHREVELQLAREEQQRRDAFVLAVLTGTIDATELGHDSAAHGLDPEREYVPFRARARSPDGANRGLSRRVALALAGDDGLVTGLDSDIVGIRARPPEPIGGVVAGLGPPARLAALPGAFALAGRALQTALAFGQEGVFTLSDLSIRPAILVDEALGDAFVARYLEPLGALGRLGADLETTLRAWLDHGMRVDETARALYVHPNTLRHRLRRFEEVTNADLRRPADLMELWWALERRRLGNGAGPAAG